MKVRLEQALFVVVLLLALTVRAYRLDDPLFHVDEAESTINALSILAHGYPTDRYLGMPIYENTLTEPWPASSEYEFRDSSYYRGMAIYHGWLPLYATAAALKLAGFEPDTVDSELRVTRSEAEMRRLTWVSRASAVLWGVLLLPLLFRMAQEVFGRDAAWAALLAGAFSTRAIEWARWSRYYSLTILLATACCLAIWRIRRQGRWRDFLAGALLLSLLFYTHVLTFAAACLVLALSALPVIRRPGTVTRFAALAAILLALTVPWIVASGFLQGAGKVPSAWPTLRFPDDLIAFLRVHRVPALFATGAAASLVAAFAVGGPLRARTEGVLGPLRPGSLFLGLWGVCCYATFVLAPAVSYSIERVALPLFGPAIVLAAGLAAALARVASFPRPALAAALGLGVPLFLAAAAPHFRGQARSPGYKQETSAFLRAARFPPGTRLFTTPNQHLIAIAYTGLPVQSIAPVRKSFLDSHAGPIVIIENIPFIAPSLQAVRKAAEIAGQVVDDAEGRRLATLVTNRAVRESLRERVAEITPPDTDTPPFLRPLIEELPRQTANAFRHRIEEFPGVFRGYPVLDHSSWWRVFFYRFVGPEMRAGPRLNYADRVRNARATVLPSGQAVLFSPGPARAAGQVTAPMEPAADSVVPSRSPRAP